ncbi:MAG: redoxin domain-containing protein [Actinobacteria bacterium]|nr:redoxin domain-containing protein [Actinomycetota bacterium]
MLDEFLNPLRLSQRALDALDSLGDIARDLGALREGVSSGMETLDETTTSIHGDMTELSTKLEGLNRMEETTASIHEDMTELSTRLEGLTRIEATTVTIHEDMTELSTRLEGLTRMEDALEDGLTELGARVKRLSKQLEILPTPQLDRGDPFPELTLEGANGPVELRERWSDGPLAVAFMRHMGCSFCREHLAQLDQAREQIRAAGGEVVAIFQNQGGDARAFCDERQVGLDCLGDPRREGYGAVG